MGPKTYEIIKLGDKTIIKGFTVDALGRQVAFVGIAMNFLDMGVNGVNWKNSTDLGVGIAALTVPGVGWVIGAVYYLADPIVTKLTGRGIGDHLGETIRNVKIGTKSVYEKFVSGISSLESGLRKWRPN